MKDSASISQCTQYKKNAAGISQFIQYTKDASSAVLDEACSQYQPVHPVDATSTSRRIGARCAQKYCTGAVLAISSEARCYNSFSKELTTLGTFFELSNAGGPRIETLDPERLDLCAGRVGAMFCAR